MTLLVSLPILSSCELLGLGGGKSKEQQYYEQQLQLMQQQQEANQKAQQAYYEALQKGLNDYLKQYSEYEQAQIQAAQNAANANPPTTIPYN